MDKIEEEKLEMVDFKLDDFVPNKTEKYRSCVVEGRPLLPSTLTTLFENGWKVISFSGYAKSQQYNKTVMDGVTVEVFTYMFENTKYGKKERV